MEIGAEYHKKLYPWAIQSPADIAPCTKSMVKDAFTFISLEKIKVEALKKQLKLF